MNILAIDDDKTILNIIEEVFQDHTTTCYKAGSFDQAKSMLAFKKIDLILLDFTLPDVTGFELLQYIRKDYKRVDLPIIMLTADRSIQIKSLEYGANDFISKPFSIDELRARTNNYLELFKHKQALHNKQIALKTEVYQQNQKLKSLLEHLSLTEKEMCMKLAQVAETGEHIRRVSHISSHLAKLYKLDYDEVSLIHNASKLHDIGNLHIPEHILKKSDDLTAEELKILQSHTSIGADLLSGPDEFTLLKAAKTIALEHHEKYDGTGYPMGKKDKEIHLYARIVAIADVFDALMSERIYKQAFSLDKALDILLKNRGKHFDPELLDLFFSFLQDFVDIHKRFPDTQDKQMDASYSEVI